MSDRQLLGDRAAVGVSDDIRFRDAERIEDPCSDIREHGHRVRNHRGLAGADPGCVKCDDSSVLKCAGEMRPALHRARHAVEQQDRITGSGGPRRDAQTANREFYRLRVNNPRRVAHQVART
jgi:hypothetical protein